MAFPTFEDILQVLRFPLGVLFAVASVWVGATPMVRMLVRMVHRTGSTAVTPTTAAAPPAETQRSRAA